MTVSNQVIALSAPAKINLFLYVTGRRPDGYHELCSLMCCVGLYDQMTLTLGSSRNEIVCDQPDVPSNAANLALKAVLTYNEALARHASFAPLKVAIELNKQIPTGAGLGGGSSDAAAVLKGLNRHYHEPFDQKQLMQMALSLGADVPFFIEGRPAIARGIGEQLAYFEGLSPLWVLLIYPGFGLSTARVFKNVTLALTKSEKELRYFPFKNGKFSVAHHLHNDLEHAVGAYFPEVQRYKKALLSQGAMGALMTGSGSVVFGLFGNEHQAQKAKHNLEQQPGTRIMIAQLLV